MRYWDLGFGIRESGRVGEWVKRRRRDWEVNLTSNVQLL
jgi:hypothetical protein